ncbi:SGNH/GDSL hydrolase family protein [Candidatus Saccharibacteria bacterium]|nr:SGNH/GDSL hydrolase family protein [Candidatus Saccharibacteria bacterium]
MALATLFSVSTHRSHADSENWFAPVTPGVTKAAELPANTSPLVSNFDCDQRAINTTTYCSASTSIGTVLNDNYLLSGNNPVSLYGYSGHGSVIPVPNSPMFFSPQPGAVTGQYVAVHRSLARSDTKLVLVGSGFSLRKQYQVTKPFDFWLTDDNGTKLQINTATLAFSSNGYWAVFDVPRVGLFRLNTTTMQLVPFGQSAEQSWFLGTYGLPITISDDGQYAAMATSSGGLMIYDLGGCSQTGYTAGQTLHFSGCQSRDMWAGQFASTSTTEDMGLKSVITNGQVLGNLRFVNDGNLRFDARYDYVSNSNYKVARYVVTASGAELHNLGLLGMGDSYISGEGEFDYVDGTDDLDTNMCHLSKLAYPYLLGASYTDSYESVACSGAQSIDITGGKNGNDYKGQVFDQLRQSDRSNISALLSNFSPGYVYQSTFTQQYQPEAILLSIGGNDIGFSDIITNCIISTENNGTCYATYEDRFELFQLINSSFQELVATYQSIKDNSPDSRIYVVGYPQIVKPDGDCGLNVHLNQEETEFAAELIKRLDAVVEDAAANAGVYYVDTQHAFDGHRLCESSGDSSAVNGVTAGRDAIPSYYLRLLGKETYHPTVLGHQLLETAIADQTNGLTKPMPAADPTILQPVLDPSDPLLLAAPASNREQYYVEPDNIITNIVQQGSTADVSVSGLSHETIANSAYDAVLHSDPIDLGAVYSDDNGDIHSTITIPATVPVGYHTLHLYGKNIAGDNIDIQKVVYITDGEQTGYCGFISDTGIDIDQDGIDDACDGVIGAAPVKSNDSSEDQTTNGNQSTDTFEPTPTINLATTNSLQVTATATQINNSPRAVIATLKPSKTDDTTGEVLGVAVTPSKQNTSSFKYWLALILAPVGLLFLLARRRYNT